MAAANYDEDINENEWYQTLCNNYDELFSRVTNERWMICVPRTGTWKSHALEDELFSQKYFESHILKEVVIYKPNSEEDDDDDDDGEKDAPSKYMTYNGKEVLIHGSKIQCSKGFDDRSHKPAYHTHEDQLELHMEAFHSSQILFEETFFNQNDESFVVVCISQPIEASLVLTSTNTDEREDSALDSQPQHYKTVGMDGNLIWNKCSNGGIRVRQQIGEVICQYNNDVYKTAPTLNERCELPEKKFDALISTYTEKVKILLQSAFQVANRDVKLKKFMESKNEAQNLHSSIENYVFDCIHECTMRRLDNLLSVNESTFNRKTRRLASIKLYHLGIKESFWSSVPRARRQLSRINKYRTAANKLKCLDLTITYLSSGSNANCDSQQMTSDDLLPLLIYLVIKCDVHNWIANVIYLKIHRFMRTSNKFDFYLTTLEAAIEHVKNNNDNLEELEQQTSPSRSNGDENLQHLFELVRTGRPDQVDMFLRQNESMKVLQEHDKCHPLCECNKCVKLDERKAQSGHSQVANATMRDERGWTALHVAAAAARHEVIDVLINHKADVTITDYHGLTALHVAAQEGSQSVIFILMHLGSNPSAMDNNSNTPLHLATLNGHDGSVKAFLYFDPTSSVVKIDARNDAGDTCLHIASRWGFVGIVEVLMECGADISLTNRISLTSIQIARDDYIKFILNNTQVCTRYEELRPLPEDQKTSSSSGSKKVKSSRLDDRSNIKNSISNKNISFLSYSSQSQNKNKDAAIDIDKEVTRLHRAVADNDINLVAFICGWPSPVSMSTTSAPDHQHQHQKCHPLCQCSTCCPPRKSCRHLHANAVALDGQAPLQVAARLGHVEMVRFLLSNGARPEGRRRGIGAHNLTAFHLAAQYGHARALEVLLSRSLSCSVDIRDGELNTPLFMSSRNGHLDCIKLLVDRGASINCRNRKGDSPLHEAARWSNIEVCKFLISTGASVYNKNEQGSTPIDIASKDVELMEEMAQALRIFHKQQINNNKKKMTTLTPSSATPPPISTRKTLTTKTNDRVDDEDEEDDPFEDYRKTMMSRTEKKKENKQTTAAVAKKQETTELCEMKQSVLCVDDVTVTSHQSRLCGDDVTVTSQQSVLCSDDVTATSQQSVLCGDDVTVTSQQSELCGDDVTVTSQQSMLCGDDVTVTSQSSNNDGKYFEISNPPVVDCANDDDVIESRDDVESLHDEYLSL